MKLPIGTISGCLIAAGIVIVLAKANGMMFEDAAISPLYEKTLADSYSRFSESDAQVPARATDPLEADLAGDPAAQMQMQPQGGRSQPNLRNMTREQQLEYARQFRAQQQQGRGAAQQGGMSQPAAGQAPAGTQGVGGQATAPPEASEHIHQGSHLFAQGKFDEALAAFRKELAANPQSAVGHHRVADVLRAQGELDAAVAAYRQVLAIQPDYHCVYVHLGEIVQQQGKASEAEPLFAKAVEGYKQQIGAGGPSATVARYHLAKFYLDQKRNLEQAVTLVEQAASASQESIYHHLLAQCYDAVGRQADAIKAIDTAIANGGASAPIYEAFKKQLTGESPRAATAPNAPPGS